MTDNKWVYTELNDYNDVTQGKFMYIKYDTRKD